MVRAVSLDDGCRYEGIKSPHFPVRQAGGVVCAQERVCMHTWIHAYTHACIHTYMHMYIHAYINACMHRKREC